MSSLLRLSIVFKTCSSDTVMDFIPGNERKLYEFKVEKPSSADLTCHIAVYGDTHSKNWWGIKDVFLDSIHSDWNACHSDSSLTKNKWVFFVMSFMGKRKDSREKYWLNNFTYCMDPYWKEGIKIFTWWKGGYFHM